MGRNSSQWSVVSDQKGKDRGRERTEVTPVEHPEGNPVPRGKQRRKEGEKALSTCKLI